MKKTKTLYLLVLLTLIYNSSQAQILTINDIRNFKIDKNTVITIDEALVDPASFPYEIIGTGGYKTRFKIADNVNASMSQGTFSEINLISDIIGPITSTSPLKILDQYVFTTGNTILQNVTDINDLLVNDVVSISGAIYAIDNSMQLSRIEKKQALDEWRLRGFAQNITANTFTIGGLTINLNGVMATGCNTGFINNTFVSIKAVPDMLYSEGIPLTTLTEIVCEVADVDEDLNDSIPVVVEGFVSEILDLVSFKINNLIVFIDAQTDIDNGEIEHLDIGTKIEVQGIIDTENRFIAAETIRFINHRVKIVAPVSPTDISLDTSINILGIEVLITPQTRDDDNIISNGLFESRQVELRGFIDEQGQIFAQRIKDKGDTDFDEITLRGDISEINQPFININGTVIDATSSLFELEEGLVTLEQFFSHIQIGMQISIEDASYDQITKVLTEGTIEIEEEELEDDPDNDLDNEVFHTQNNANREIIGTGGIGIATVTGTEMIFRSGLE